MTDRRGTESIKSEMGRDRSSSYYEVRKDGRTVNPIYFFYENLTAGEYTQLATRVNPEEAYQPYAMSQK